MTYYKVIDDELVEMTEEEAAEVQTRIDATDACENSRPLTSEEVMQMLLKTQVNTIPVDDSTALRMKAYYPTWEECCEQGTVNYDKAGFKFTYGNKLYSCLNANPSFQSSWIPGVGTESLYAVIDETHAGTLEDPIPYDGNMALENGKYYSQGGHIYLCNRDTVNPVYNPLADLVGLYVELVM